MNEDDKALVFVIALLVILALQMWLILGGLHALREVLPW